MVLNACRVTYKNQIDVSLQYEIIIHCLQWQIMAGRGYRQTPKAATSSAYYTRSPLDHHLFSD